MTTSTLSSPPHIFTEHDVVRTRTPIEAEGASISPGVAGTVVSVYGCGEAYAVEFDTGQSSIVITALPHQLDAALA